MTRKLHSSANSFAYISCRRSLQHWSFLQMEESTCTCEAKGQFYKLRVWGPVFFLHVHVKARPQIKANTCLFYSCIHFISRCFEVMMQKKYSTNRLPLVWDMVYLLEMKEWQVFTSLSTEINRPTVFWNQTCLFVTWDEAFVHKQLIHRCLKLYL